MKFFFLAAILLWSGKWPHAQAQGAIQLLPVSSRPDTTVVDTAVFDTGVEGSTYVPVDNWIYPALDRLHAMGYVDSAFLGLRPWTRLSIAHMLELSADSIETDANNDEARTIYFAVLREVKQDSDHGTSLIHPRPVLESVYSQFRVIAGTPLRDSFHLGQTIIDDYGRPYERGFTNYTGFSARAEAGRFSFYYRGEFQHAASATGYSSALAAYLSNCIDGIPLSSFSNSINPPLGCAGGIPPATSPMQDTIPEGPIAATNDLRVMEATLSYHLMGHEVSFGKNDHWLGPDQGASMLWSNNAENIYAFEINRIEPVRVPLLSRLTGPLRYDFFVGSLKGHTYPNDPWVHMEKISFKPTRNLEFGFDRLTIWGGKGHEPITLHTFLHGFFSLQNVSVAEKNSRSDPGARLGTFDFTYRLPFLRKWVTLYTDSLCHDDVSPVSAPRRSGYHPGVYLSRLPGIEHLDLRVEGASTDTASKSLDQGQFLYWENVQRQGPTNKGILVGDWVGRQGKGGQAWLTYHLSPQEELRFAYRNAKVANAFIPGGTTQNDFSIMVSKRFQKEIEFRGWIQYEDWKAPVYMTGAQNGLSAVAQITWFPHESN